MATLNGVEFGILSKTITVVHDNIVTDIPGSDQVVVEDLGYSTEPIALTCMVKNEDEFDDFKEEYYSGGILTLIVDPNSNKQYKVYALRNITEYPGNMTYPLTNIVFACSFHSTTPYKESTEDVTLTKTITTQNQEFSSDDTGLAISTLGNVDAVPDISITAGAYDLDNCDRSSGETWSETHTTEYNSYSDTYAVKYTKIWSAIEGRALHLTLVGVDLRTTQNLKTAYCKVTAQATGYMSGVETQIAEFTESYETYVAKSLAVDVLCGHNAALTIRYYLKNKESGYGTYAKNFDSSGDNNRANCVSGVSVYNAADNTIQCYLCNELEKDTVTTVNVDGSGTYDYADLFQDDDCRYAAWDLASASYDSGDYELDIADGGHATYKFDIRFPINGIPTMLADISITAGTPTIQIALDDGTGVPDTFYDIDTAIVHEVETSYPLISEGNLELAGNTLFYVRFDCTGAGTVTCSLRSIALAVLRHTVYAQNPKIYKGGSANTYRVDQDADSSMDCTIVMTYPHRWWM